MFGIMELEQHNSSLNSLASLSNHNIGNQEVYAQDDQSFEADQENLNSSTSSDRFYQTPSAKFIYEQTSTTAKKQPSQNVRQTLFQNLDPLNESNGQNQTLYQNSTLINHSLDSSTCTEKTIISKHPESHTILSDRSFLNENNNAFLNDEHLMDLSNQPANSVTDGHQQSNSQQYEDALREKDQTNEKLTNYIEQLNQLNKHLSDAILAVQDKFEASLNEKNAVIQDLNLQSSVLAKEKKLALEDVQGLENSFSELHRRYEKLKLALESCKKKEEMFQEECLAFSEKLEESQRLNGEYKQRLEILENERDNIVETVKKQSEKEVTMLKAQLKKVEMRFNGLTSQLDQKTQENLELNKMIDELTK